MTADPDSENPDLVKQHVKKNRMGDRELAEKPGDKPPHKGEAEQRQPSGGQVNRDNRPDKDETYRQGRQGTK